MTQDMNQKKNQLPINIEKEILIKDEAEGHYGKNPYERTIDELIKFGVINLNKPEGPTSHQVASYVRDIIGIKTGHSGTLDPQVSGVLPIGTGKATRLMHYLLTTGKEYVGVMHLHREIEKQKIFEMAKRFTGKIKQLPPVRSSVKRRWRYRHVYYFNILEIKGKDVLFRVGVEAGTYIRKLCHDFGKALGIGAHMTHLRRTKVGFFDESNSWHLYDIKDALWFWKNEGYEGYIRKVILPGEEAVKHIPKIWVKDPTVYYLTHGGNLFVPGIVKLTSDVQANKYVAVYTLKDELIMIGKAKLNASQILEMKKGLAVENDRVYMSQDYFPKITEKLK